MEVKYKYAIVAIIVIAIIAAAVFGYYQLTAPAPREEIVLGAPLSMGFLYGWDADKNLRMAVDEINAAGGVKIAGKTYYFKYVPMETRDLEPGVPVEEAIRVVEKLITEKGARFIVGGPVRSEAAIGAMPTVSKYKVVHILTTGSLSPTINDMIAKEYDKYKYTFRITGESRGLAKQAFDILSYTREKYGFSKVYIMVQDVAHARAVGTALKGLLEKAGGWEVLGFDVYPTGATDYSVSLLKAKELGAQILFIWMDHPETAILARQWYELKVPALPVSGICAFVEQPGSYSVSGGALEYWLACPVNTGNAISKYPPAVEYFEKHKKVLGIEPEGYGAVSSYIAPYLLKAALEKAGSLDPEAVIKALEEIEFRGPYGLIKFDPKTHQVVESYDPEKGAAPCWFQWQGGKRIQVWPPTVAAGEIKIPPWMMPKS